MSPVVDAGVEVPAPSVISRQLSVPPGNVGRDNIPFAALLGGELEQMINQSQLLAGNLANQLQNLTDRGQLLTGLPTLQTTKDNTLRTKYTRNCNRRLIKLWST
ncbi:hypothetical protein BU17DRAFT_60317 [Hysterangium stoloniferum]|nr:hypothetical protein BU17DRAFT_60317 [Hysterangium stoloniferum]